jgi:hypothetical protein
MAIDVFAQGNLPFPRSLPEFQRLFPDEAACAAYLERARWNDGFICELCSSSGEPYRLRAIDLVGSVVTWSLTCPSLRTGTCGTEGGNRKEANVSGCTPHQIDRSPTPSPRA